MHKAANFKSAGSTNFPTLAIFLNLRCGIFNRSALFQKFLDCFGTGHWAHRLVHVNEMLCNLVKGWTAIYLTYWLLYRSAITVASSAQQEFLAVHKLCLGGNAIMRNQILDNCLSE